ncbi:MAG: hypothetical protein KBS59_07370, partial [Clostridiales bacterium]|nr:hypothetical protein [Clostridiales bacterium]
MKRLIAVALALLMVVSVLALTSCSEDPTPTEPTGSQATTPRKQTPTTQGGDNDPASTQGTSGTQGGSDPATPTTGSTQGGTTPTPGGDDGYSRPEGYLDVDFGGRTFTFLTTKDVSDVSEGSDSLGRWSTIKEVYVESREGGTIIDTAVYDRNAVMKQLYKCNILGLYVDDAGTLMSNDILAGTNDYDFISNEYQFFCTPNPENYLNIWDLDFDFDLPGWNMALINETSMVDNNGVKKLTAFDGDFNLMGYKGTWALTMNLDLYNQNFTEDIFEIVKSKEWTMDKVTELCSKVKKENGDQTWKPGEDTFGLETSAYDAYG